MSKSIFLVTGACGQLGTEITEELRKVYGENQVIASDLYDFPTEPLANGPYEKLDICSAQEITTVIEKHKVTQIYHLAALLSAKAEVMPLLGWQVNMNGLLNILECSRLSGKIDKIFFPSTIAIFGPNSPKENTPQYCITDPETIYGIGKLAGEQLCAWYFRKHNLDIRSIRYPGLIGYKAMPGGGTTDYAVEIFHKAVNEGKYTSFLKPDTALPMMYMPDALQGTFSLMEAEGKCLSLKAGYNLAAFSFSPEVLANEIVKHLPEFKMDYLPDSRETIARTWPVSIDDSQARQDWGWAPKWSLAAMAEDMLEKCALKYGKLALEKTIK